MVRALGGDVESVETGAAAMVAAEGKDLLVLDIGLEDADGRALAGALRAEAGYRGAILCISGLGGEARRREALAAGADAFAEKPFETAADFTAAMLAALAARGGGTAAATEAADRPALSGRVLTGARADLIRARARLIQGLAAGDHAAVRRAAHFLSGVAGVLGDHALAEASRRAAERDPDAGPLRAVETMLDLAARAAERLRAPREAA